MCVRACVHCTVVVLCASPDSVREIMIKVHELNFDNGEYVFINIDLFSRYPPLLAVLRYYYLDLHTAFSAKFH